ncbi:MAG: hypothetical protein ACP5UQ_10350 [Anaerolineae bacterium]
MSEERYANPQAPWPEAGHGLAMEAQDAADMAQRPKRPAAENGTRRPAWGWISPRLEALILLLVFVAGASSGYVLRGLIPVLQAQRAEAAATSLRKQVTPAAGFTLPATYGEIGPQLLRVGAIDEDKFVRLYQTNGRPLNDEQLAILRQGSQAPIVINQQNAYFMLNFFWALGLVNKNPILEQGPMMQAGKQNVGNFASTGGWTLGARTATALYASVEIVKLTAEQQARLEEVAANVYRPCCNNPTSFPDCNHGMALLGLLELMAGQDATVDQMFTAAKQVTAFWFPEQMLEVATFFRAVEGKDFATADPRRIVGQDFMSASGFQATHQALSAKGLLPQAPKGGSSCGV